MRVAPLMLRLGGEEWPLRPLTLKQIQEIEPLLRQDDSAGSIAAAVAIVAVALSRDHPAAAEKLIEIEATTQEIGAAMREVLRLGGFIAKEGEAAPGEAPAGAD
jgi:hypothetical protein